MWILILAAVVGYFVFYRPYQEKRKAEREAAVYQELSNLGYVQTAMKFLAFYQLLPQKSMLIVTPQYIGVRISSNERNNYFGVNVSTYLTSCRDQPQFESAFMENFFEQGKESLGGDGGIQLFQELKLQMKLHDGDDDMPVIYMLLPGGEDFLKQHQYVRAIEKKYQEVYHEQFKIIHVENY